MQSMLPCEYTKSNVVCNKETKRQPSFSIRANGSVASTSCGITHPTKRYSIEDKLLRHTHTGCHFFALPCTVIIVLTSPSSAAILTGLHLFN
jgi:hypothetical protein